MNKLTSLLAVPLLLASASAWSATGSSANLTYCLDLKTNAAIAKCAGEVSAGNKGKPFTKEEVAKILSQEKPEAPASANKPTEMPTAPDSVNEPTEKPAAPASANEPTEKPAPTVVNISVTNESSKH